MKTATPKTARVTKHVAPRARRGFVTISQKEYLRLQMAAAPVVYLKGKAAKTLDKSVRDVLREHAEGKTIKAASISEALKKYKQMHAR